MAAEEIGHDETLHGEPPPGPPAAPQRPLAEPEPRLPADLDRSSLSQRERALKLTRYVLLRRLGAGGMGVVYQAYDPSLDRKVAIKLLRAAPGDEHAEQAHARLLREAQALAKLSNPNVVAVYDVDTYDADVLTTMRIGTGHTEPVPRAKKSGLVGVFLVMEYVQGVTLAQWLDERIRPVRGVIEVFLAAGRGLVAAHAVGVIHRDFKPGNVLVGEGGRVCVFDFGLARAAGEFEAVEPGVGHPADLLSSSSLSAPLTRVGSIVGTPAYTPPEQRGGTPIDERADQYSFCVALYEALYGNRPFTGDNIFALEEAKATLRLDPPRRSVRVPPAIHRAIVRGLAPLPEERWPSMSALLDALERPFRGRRRTWLAAGALALAAGAGAFVLARGDDAALCSGAAEAIAPTWGAPQRDAIAAAFATTGLPYAADAAARAAGSLDAWTREWIAGHTEACEAANVRGEQSHDLLDRRMRCLEGRRRELAAVVAVLVAADAGAVEHARDAVEQLPSPAQCADIDALLADVAPPPPEIEPEVAAIRDLIAAADAQYGVGHYAAGHEIAAEADRRASAIDYRPLRARSMLELAEQTATLGEADAAEHQFADTFWEALATGQDRIAFNAAVRLAGHVGEILARPDDAVLWLRTAEALLDRNGGPLDLAAMLEFARGQVAEQKGALADAVEHYRRSLDLESDAVQQRVARMSHLGNVEMALGHLDEAQALFERLLALRRENYGHEHPSTAVGLADLGNVATLRGDLEAAERHHRASLAVMRRVLPPRHDNLAYPLSSLGDIALHRGELAAALDAFEEARAIWEETLGPQHPRVAAMLERIAATELPRGDLGLAEQHAGRALAILSAVQGTEVQGVVLSRLTLSQIELARGNAGAARDHTDAALPLAESAFGKQHLYTGAVRAQRALALARLGDLSNAAREADEAVVAVEAGGGATPWLAPIHGARGEVHKAAGRLAEARADLERALSLLDAHGAPLDRADLEFLLAQVLWDMSEDRPKARALAQGAQAALRRVEAPLREREVTAWLAGHPG
jgi:serine/threonine protein kinase